MDTARDEHLSADEIARCVEAEERATADGEEIEQFAPHVDECSKCQAEIAMERKHRGRLRGLRMSTLPQAGSASCPGADEWAKLAAGLIGGAEADRLLHHASECDACGAELRKVTECFSDSLTDDDQRVLAGLKTSTEQWREAFIRRLTYRRHRSYAPAWIAIAAAALVGVAIWWIGRPSGVTRTEALLAQAYSEERRFDLRLPGADQARLQVRRGAEFQRPEALLEAELRIGRAIRGQSPNAKWLDLDARADLLELKPQAAIDSLTKAENASGGNADVAIATDLGCAYALRGELEDRPSDYMQAIEDFRQALATRPRLAVAAFNLALVYEKLKLYNQAESAWRSYLSIDPNSSWATEARARLDDISKKKLGAAH